MAQPTVSLLLECLACIQSVAAERGPGEFWVSQAWLLQNFSEPLKCPLLCEVLGCLGECGLPTVFHFFAGCLLARVGRYALVEGAGVGGILMIFPCISASVGCPAQVSGAVDSMLGLVTPVCLRPDVLEGPPSTVLRA